MNSRPENKTQPTAASVEEFINGLDTEQKRADSRRLVELMRGITGHDPVMWGPTIIGFDTYHYRYDSGREGDMAAAGFSPRKANLVVYLLDASSRHPELLARLGPHSTGKACLYLKRLSDIDLDVLEELVRASYQYVQSRKNDMHRA